MLEPSGILRGLVDHDRFPDLVGGGAARPEHDVPLRWVSDLLQSNLDGLRARAGSTGLHSAGPNARDGAGYWSPVREIDPPAPMTVLPGAQRLLVVDGSRPGVGRSPVAGGCPALRQARPTFVIEHLFSLRTAAIYDSDGHENSSAPPSKANLIKPLRLIHAAW